jgi:hypothetical protein
LSRGGTAMLRFQSMVELADMRMGSSVPEIRM